MPSNGFVDDHAADASRSGAMYASDTSPFQANRVEGRCMGGFSPRDIPNLNNCDSRVRALISTAHV